MILPVMTARHETRGQVLSERSDRLVKTVAKQTTRRSALLGMGGLALGALGRLGASQASEAKQTNANRCSACKSACQRNNRKSGKKHPHHCSQKCRNMGNDN
jgi:hypothetical protein